ncbi:allose kinase [Thiothrix eikelboomii]|uniref:Allose kinase n=1 Tax=Thiothrix eikelboomii TaxID=92487 RepID=A0A1T4WZR8_9GAMM|nr:ROK family protein [Thiothrix eikelboomii]SKA82883.1 allose kinase [Thiothrix eikelboomii]
MNSHSILVVDIGGTNVKFAAIHQGQHLTETQQRPTADLRNGDPISNLARAILEVSAELGLSPQAVVATVPGLLDPNRDLVRFAGNIPEFNGRLLASQLMELVGIPVILERDAIISLRGEWQAGAGSGVNNLLGLFFGTGVGGAFLQDGQPFRGSGFALEIGNMPFGREGRQLQGMRTDCLESYVSGRVLQSIADRHSVPIQNVFLQAAEGGGLQAAIDDFIADQSIAIGIAFSLFSPDALVLGGGICDMAGFPRERLAKLVEENSTVRESGNTLDLRWASLGWGAVLHGAEVTVDEQVGRF